MQQETESMLKDVNWQNKIDKKGSKEHGQSIQREECFIDQL